MDKKKLLGLSWNNPLYIQEKSIYEISAMESLNLKDLLQPGSKEYWENAAKVLFIIGYPRIKDIIPGLLVWLQDINWPGSMIVIDILRMVPKNVLVVYLEKAVIEAVGVSDEIWIENLSYLLIKFELRENDFKSKDVYLTLLSSSNIWK